MVLVVGLVLAHEPNGRLWAREISKRADLKPRAVGRVLERMANDGWLTDEYESTTGKARKARRFYRPTPRGLTALRAICEYAQHNAIYRRWLPAVFPVLPGEQQVDQAENPDNHQNTDRDTDRDNHHDRERGDGQGGRDHDGADRVRTSRPRYFADLFSRNPARDHRVAPANVPHTERMPRKGRLNFRSIPAIPVVPMCGEDSTDLLAPAANL
jgi:DNA-binding PadR family transcriptional regulator